MTKVKRLDTDTHHGYLYEERYESGYETGCIFLSDSEVTEHQIGERQRWSWMPVEYVYKSAKDFDWSVYGEDMTFQKKIVNDFVTEFDSYRREGRGLYISSETCGSGKTFLACCVANEIMKKHDISVKFISVPDYIELVKGKDDGSREKRETLMDASLLILDDIGAQVENKDWITTAMFRLLDRRYTNHLPTIFTSNVHREDLETKTDGRTFERIYGPSTPVVMPEVSVRRQIADKHTKEFLDRISAEGKG